MPPLAPRLRFLAVAIGVTLALFAPTTASADETVEPPTAEPPTVEPPTEGPPTEEPPPVDLPTPTVTGAPIVGETLTARAGDWPDDVELSYQWLRDGDPIEGAASPTLKLTSRDFEKKLQVEVSGVVDEQPRARTSEPTLHVANAPKPTVTGNHAVNSTLSARTAGWSPSTKFTYRWYANGAPIKGATKSTFRLTKAQGSKRIAVKVTGTKPDYPTASRVSATSSKVFTAAPAPKISGSAAVGRVLKVSRGKWTSGAKVTYRWYADDVAIKGAVKSTYKITSGAAGKRITVRATGTKPGYAKVVKKSAVKPATQRIGKPRLGGSTLATKRVTVSPGSWVSGTRFSYAWYLNGKRISGAKSSSILVKPSWKGKRLSAKVTGRKNGYSTFSATTARSKKITLPGRTAPASAWTCPSWAPIKGNANSGIYHLPRHRFYKATKPEDCFSTQSAARRAGYRKAKV